MDYDDLDEKLTGQGYKFNSKSGVVLDSFHSYVWSKDNTKSAISILVQRDTISTYSEGNNLGYVDVNKYAINYFTLNPDFYTNILNEVKKSTSFKKVYSNIENNAIISEYESEDFYIDFTKDNSNKQIMYNIRILDKSYEILDVSLDENTKIKYKHSKKRIKPFTN